ILFVVLESTRADTWHTPDITPGFHDWKSNGVYFPRAVAQYPATPLAYGAMFTSQPPRVLAESPYWSVEPPFAPVAATFDRLIATRPDVSWFDTNAIRDFVLPDDIEANRHRDASEGLEYARRQLEEAPDRSFFAWIHLYEPHQPWEPREGYLEGEGQAAAYRSEVAHMDDALTKFMTWFHRQPFADDTLVVVISDHGEGLGEVIQGAPYWGHHVYVRNVVSQIPLYASGPGLPKDAVEDRLGAQQMDLLPTFYDFVGVRPSHGLFMQGTSLYRLLETPRERPLVTQAFSFRGHAFFDFVDRAKHMHPEDMRRAFDKTTITSSRYAPKTAIQYGRYKLIRDEWLQRDRLYDIREDPGEAHDLSGSHPDVLGQMRGRFADWELRQRAVIQRLNRNASSEATD
ncbi:MAG: sulfatase-like hydrolase/transferase, partial [Myxococcota bacterium]